MKLTINNNLIIVAYISLCGEVLQVSREVNFRVFVIYDI